MRVISSVGADTGTMRIHHYSLPIVLLVLIRYATTSSIAEVTNTRPTITQQQQLPTIHEPEEMMTENDGEDSDDFESSASELVQVQALPETLNLDDPKGGPENGASFQRSRRRRRRRRRKRPKTTASPGPDGSFAATSPGPAAPATFVGKAENDGLHLYYAVPEEEIHKKPFKYRPGIDDAFLPHVAAVYDDEGYTTPRRRVTKRRRRPFKKPSLSVDHHPSLVQGTNDDENGDTSIPSVNEADNDDTIGVKGPNLFKQTTTTTTTTESVLVTSPKDSDNSLKKQKSSVSAAEVAKKPQYSRNDAKEDQSDQHQHQAQPHNIQHNVIEQQSKLVENRKELFKMRRLPPTWAILGHPKHKASSSSSFFAATKNLTDSDNAPHSQSKPISQVTAEADNSPISASTPLTWSSTFSSTTAQNNRVRESDNERVISSTFKPKSKEVKERPPSTTEAKLAEDEPEDDEEPKQNQKQKQEPGNSTDTTTTPYQFPIIAYTGQKPIDSNTSAFLSSNEQRLAIIYIPCNQTAEKIIPSDGGSSASFIHSGERSLSTKSSPIPLETTTRKISTTSSPDTGQSGQLDSLSFGSAVHLEKAKWSSTAKPTTSLWSPSPSLSTITEKLSTDANIVMVTSTTIYTNREAKRYHDAGIPKANSDLAKEEKISSLRSKPYGSAGPNSAFIKPFAGSSREIVISYTSTTNSPPSLFSYHNIDSADEQISLQLNNNNNSGLIYRKSHENRKQPQQQHAERKKLPLAVKSAIIISGAVLALAVLGFFALLLSCKIRQAKSRMKCHRELYRDQFQSNEFRQSSRSTSPVMSKSNFNTRNLTNNIQPTNVAAAAAPNNRNYYLWQTLRKTFQYD